MIFNDFLKALAQLPERRFQGVFWLGIGITIATLFVITSVFGWFAGWLVPDNFALPVIGEVTWLDDAATFAGIGVMLVASIFLMVPVASAVTGFFLESVAQAVEDKHYPHLSDVDPMPIADVIRDSVGFFGLMLLVNLVGLIVYLLSGPLAPFVFWAVNGFLLGREYFQMVAMRRIGRQAASALRKRYSLRIWFAGCLMAVPLSVPIVNLLVPVLGAATFTHQFHRLASRGQA